MKLTNHYTKRLLGFGLLAVFPVLGMAQTKVFKGATIYPISGEPIENGVLIVKDGKIEAVGKVSDIQIPNGAEVHDVSGKVMMPGLVDSHSHIGNGDGGDGSSPLHPDVRVLDAVDVNSDTFKKARAGGITTVNVMPGSGHLMSGQTVYLKLRSNPKTINDMLFVKDPINEIAGGLKMANGTNALRGGNFPGTRAKSAAMVRELFVKAVEYKAKVDEAKKNKKATAPARDIKMESLVQVLEGKRIVHFHTHRHDDILTVLRLKEEFGFRVVLHHVSEGWKIADEIAKAGVPCSIITIDSPGGKMEAVDLIFETGGVLEKAGVLTGYHTDDGITDSRLFLRSAAIGVRAGMSKAKALEAVTIANAKMLDLDKRVGTLEKGKDADFLILSGDPLSVYTHVEQTWVEGTKVFDRSNPEDLKFFTGGMEVFRGEHYSHHDNEFAEID
ncbi:amidohydrolase [bacterium]|nr:MAG: amidohydrolase [bacterium]